jgi:hypothetical protein
MTTNDKLDRSQLDEKTTHIFDVYRRSRGIYERSEIAMGRRQGYRVTMANATGVKIGDKRKSP